MKATSRHAAEQKRGSPVQTPYYCLWVLEQRKPSELLSAFHSVTSPDGSEIPALTGLQLNHKNMNKVWLQEYSVGSQNNIVAGMLPRMSKYFRSGRKRTIQSLEAHKITWSQTQMQKYDLSVASAKCFGIGSGKYIYLTFSSEVLWEASNNWRMGSWNLCVSFAWLWAGNAESCVGPQVEMRTGSGEMYKAIMISLK